MVWFTICSKTRQNMIITIFRGNAYLFIKVTKGVLYFQDSIIAHPSRLNVCYLFAWVNVRSFLLSVAHQSLHTCQVLPIRLAIHHMRHIGRTNLFSSTPGVYPHHCHADWPCCTANGHIHVAIMCSYEFSGFTINNNIKKLRLHLFLKLTTFAHLK